MKFETFQIPNGFRGDAIQVASPGNGIPCADPKLTVLYSQQIPGAVLDIVSGTAIAVGVNENGYLEPASEKIAPIGIIDTPLLGTAQFATDKPMDEKYSGIGCATSGAPNYGLTLDQITPRVYQRNVMFQMGIAYKTDGETKALFEIKSGDCLRVIKTEEIEASIKDETLPILFAGETASGDHKKTAAMYAGRLVKWDAEKDKAHEIAGRAMMHRNPVQYDNYVYEGDWAYGMDIQGPATKGLSRDVFNMIGTVLNKKEYTKTILDFCVTL